MSNPVLVADLVLLSFVYIQKLMRPPPMNGNIQGPLLHNMIVNRKITRKKIEIIKLLAQNINLSQLLLNRSNGHLSERSLIKGLLKMLQTFSKHKHIRLDFLSLFVDTTVLKCKFEFSL